MPAIIGSIISIIKSIQNNNTNGTGNITQLSSGIDNLVNGFKSGNSGSKPIRQRS